MIGAVTAGDATGVATGAVGVDARLKSEINPEKLEGRKMLDINH